MTEERQLMEVILYVEDMGAQVRFYRDIMGLRVRQSEEAQDLDEPYWVELETGPCTLALHAGARGTSAPTRPRLSFA
ncbi:VOC family protein [Chloroflexota bacterium]